MLVADHIPARTLLFMTDFGESPLMSSSPTGASGRQFLFAILAMDRRLISRDIVVAAFHAWSFDKSIPLARRLVNQGAIGESAALEFEAIIDRHLKEHWPDRRPQNRSERRSWQETAS